MAHRKGASPKNLDLPFTVEDAFITTFYSQAGQVLATDIFEERPKFEWIAERIKMLSRTAGQYVKYYKTEPIEAVHWNA